MHSQRQVSLMPLTRLTLAYSQPNPLWTSSPNRSAPSDSNLPNSHTHTLAHKLAVLRQRDPVRALAVEHLINDLFDELT